MFLTPVEIIDSTGDGLGNTLGNPFDVATDSSGNVFVTGGFSDNAFKITPAGTITEIIDSTGDGAGNTFNQPFGVATDSSGNVFVAGASSHNAFKIELVLGPAIGGIPIPIDTTALLVAGAQTMTPWLILVVISAVGIGLAVFTLKRSR